LRRRFAENEHRSRSHDAVIRVYDETGNVIDILGALPEDAFVEQALAQFAASNREPR
jgi:hypothetical protein